MVKLITTRGVVYATPVIEGGKPVMQKVKHNNREVTVPFVDHHRCEANQVINVPDQIAKELIAEKCARKYDAVLDGDAVEADEGAAQTNDPLA